MSDKEFVLRTSEDARKILGGIVRQISIVNVVVIDEYSSPRQVPKFVIEVEDDKDRIIRYEGDLRLAKD